MRKLEKGGQFHCEKKMFGCCSVNGAWTGGSERGTQVPGWVHWATDGMQADVAQHPTDVLRGVQDGGAVLPATHPHGLQVRSDRVLPVE